MPSQPTPLAEIWSCTLLVHECPKLHDNRTVTVPSARGLRTEAAPADSVRFPCRGCGVHDNARFPYGLCRSVAEGPYKKSHVARIQCKHTYVVARSHLRCLKNHTENRKQINRTASWGRCNPDIIVFTKQNKKVKKKKKKKSLIFHSNCLWRRLKWNAKTSVKKMLFQMLSV